MSQEVELGSKRDVIVLDLGSISRKDLKRLRCGDHDDLWWRVRQRLHGTKLPGSSDIPLVVVLYKKRKKKKSSGGFPMPFPFSFR